MESIVAADSAETVTLPVPLASTTGVRELPSEVPILAATVFVVVVLARITPAARPTALLPTATDRLPAPVSVLIFGLSSATRLTDPLPAVPAVALADRISARVVVPNVASTVAPDPAAAIAVEPAATLMATPAATASISCADRAKRERSPPACTLASSIAALAEFVIVILLMAAPTATCAAAELLSAMPSEPPPALDSIFEESVAETVTAPAETTVAPT